MSYKYLNHTADIIVHAKGKNLIEAFEQAALAYFDLLTDITLIDQKVSKEITIEAEDHASLLYDWINELIFIFDTELLVFNKIEITYLEKTDKGNYVLRATLAGEEFDIKKHTQETEVKAMTYSFMKIDKDSVEFTLDL